MRLVALISGGKDSVYNMLQCIAAGHEIVALANIEPETTGELDSYMYQSVGHEVISLISVASGLPMYRHKTKGVALCKDKIYVKTEKDEVEDLFDLILDVKKELHVEGVSVGAIASDYQRTRVENVCRRLGLKSFAYLWRRNQTELLQEMIDAELDAVLIKVACIGLIPERHLGMHIKDVKAHLMDLNKKYEVNVCGEGGEYETLTLDCPLFFKKLSIVDSKHVISTEAAFASVGFLNVKNAILKTKGKGQDQSDFEQKRIEYIKSIVKNPYHYVSDCVDDLSLNVFPELHSPSNNTSPCAIDLDSDVSINANSPLTTSDYWNEASTFRQHRNLKKPIIRSKSDFAVADSILVNLNFSGGWCCIGNITGKTIEYAFLSLQENLNRIQYEFHDLVFVHIVLNDMSDFPCLNKQYSSYIPDVSPPARVCISSDLPPNTSISIMVIAHKPRSKSEKNFTNESPSRHHMHVESISNWAPANLGPYSQCVKINGLYFLAGQIPLIPGTMEILSKSVFHQCKLTLRHVLRILQAMDSSLNFSSVAQAICYTTSDGIVDDIFSLWPYITKNKTATLAIVVVSELPKKAQLEWEIVACSYENPEIIGSHDIVENYHLSMKKCIYQEPYASSFVCNVSEKKVEDGVTPIKFNEEILINVFKHCLEFLRDKDNNFNYHLSMIKLFYKTSAFETTQVISDFFRIFHFDQKVVITGVPVLECQDPDVFVTITGIFY